MTPKTSYLQYAHGRRSRGTRKRATEGREGAKGLKQRTMADAISMDNMPGGCCAESVPMCFPAGEFILGDTDLLLGMIEDCPFYIDARTYQS